MARGRRRSRRDRIRATRHDRRRPLARRSARRRHNLASRSRSNDIRRFVQGDGQPEPAVLRRRLRGRESLRPDRRAAVVLRGGVGNRRRRVDPGTIPGSHMLFGGDEQWFYGPRFFPGDKLSMDRMIFDYRVTNTAFAGPTMFQRGDTTYVNQKGEFIAKQRSTSIRYLVSNVAELNAFAGQDKEPEWTDEQLEEIYQQAPHLDPLVPRPQEASLGRRRDRRADDRAGDRSALDPDLSPPSGVATRACGWVPRCRAPST